MSFCQSKSLSITTRGIGLSTCNLCFVSANVANINPPMYAMYRVFLGLVEAKLASIKELCYFVKELCYVYDYQVEPYMLETPLDVVIVPEPIKRIIDAVDVINYNDIQYIPVVAAQVYDEEGKLVPRPENLLLSNLRNVVVALSSKDTPAKYRTAFREYCPIPGAIWDNDDFLMNANEIIPEDYNLEKGLLNDMWPLSTYLIRMRQKFPNIANGAISKFLPNLPVDTKASSKGTYTISIKDTNASLKASKASLKGSKAAFVSRDMSLVNLCASLRNIGEPLVEYFNRCNPQVGSARSGEFNVIDKVVVSLDEHLDGQVALLGEYPNEKMLGQYPVLGLYSLRIKNEGSSELVGQYLNAVMASNAALFFSVKAQIHSEEESKLVKGRKQYYDYDDE